MTEYIASSQVCTARAVTRKSVSRCRRYSARAQSTRKRVDRKMSKSRNVELSDSNDFGGTRVKCSGSCSTEAFRYWQTIITFHEQSRAIYSFRAAFRDYSISLLHKKERKREREIVIRYHNFSHLQS